VTQLVAEIGISHCGNTDVALRLTQEAIEAGADVVKLQRFHAHPVLRERLGDFLLPDSGYTKVQRMLYTAGRQFACSVFSPGDAEWMDGIGCDVLKIPSGRVFNKKLIDAVNATKRRAWVSLGMMRAATYDWVRKLDNMDGVLLCRSLYPTPVKDICLEGISHLAGEFEHSKIGYSCHCPRAEVPIAAAALGADMVEVHFSKQGPDAAVSFTQSELRHIRHMFNRVGSGYTEPYEPTMEEVNKLISIIEDDQCVS
jgi:sialic acid synthase SpsE